MQHIPRHGLHRRPKQPQHWQLPRKPTRSIPCLHTIRTLSSSLNTTGSNSMALPLSFVSSHPTISFCPALCYPSPARSMSCYSLKEKGSVTRHLLQVIHPYQTRERWWWQWEGERTLGKNHKVSLCCNVLFLSWNSISWTHFLISQPYLFLLDLLFWSFSYGLPFSSSFDY